MGGSSIQASNEMMKRFEQFQVDTLALAFEECDHLTKQKKIELVNQTGLGVEQITSWFNRKRKDKRDKEARRALERRNGELQRALQESSEREANLQQELEEYRRREVELRAEIQHLTHQLGTVALDSDIDPILSFVNGYE